jgi:hypothetical protein
MSKWKEEKAENNLRSLVRLNKAFRALGRPFVPPTPRLAIDSYWGAHPLRADRLARALAASSGAPRGWSWRLGNNNVYLRIDFRCGRLGCVGCNNPLVSATDP